MDGSGDQMDALSEDVPGKIPKSVRGFLDASEDVESCQKNISEGDVSDGIVVTGFQAGGEEVVECLIENDGMRHDHFHVGRKDDEVDRWINRVAVRDEEVWSFDFGCTCYWWRIVRGCVMVVGGHY